MRKLLLLFFALLGLCSSGAWATDYYQGAQVTTAEGLVNGHSYVIRVSSGSYITENNSQYEAPNTQNAITANAVFKFIADGSSWKVLNETTGNYWGTLTGSATGTFATATEATAGSWIFTFTDNNVDAQSGEYHINRSSGVLHGWNSAINLQIYNVETALTPDSKTFTLHCARGYVYYNGSALAGTANKEKASEFAIVSFNGTNYLYDATQKAFVCHTTAAQAGGSGNAALESSNDLSKAVTGLKRGVTNISTYPFYLADSFGNWLNMDGTPLVYFNTWKDFESGTGGNTYQIEEGSAFDATEAQKILANYFNNVTYKVLFEASGTVFATATERQSVGSAISLPSSLTNSYCTYEYYSDAACTAVATEVTANATIYVKVTNTTSLPFTFASSTDADDATWYTLKLRDNYVYNDDNGAFGISDSEVVSNDGQWVFTGNVYAAQVYNKGAEKYLVWNGSAIVFSETATTSWMIKPHGTGFILYEPSSYNFPFVNSSGNVAYSTSGNGNYTESGNSARFVPTEVADDFHESIVANVQPYFTSGVGSNFGLKSTVYDTYNARVTTAATTCSASEYAELLAVVNNAANYVFPESGYYRIKNYNGGYFGKTTSEYASNLTSTDAASVVYLTRSGEEGAYTYTIQLQGVTFTDQTGTFTLSVAAPGYFYMNDRTSNTVFGYIHKSGTAIAVNSIASATTSAQWILEPATTFTGTLTDAKDNTGAGHSYATLCVPFAISGITGASAYAPSISGNMLNMGTGATSIAAGTPVVLIGAAGAGTYTATINTASAPVSEVASAPLSGTFTGTALDCTAATGTTYVLGFDADNDNRIGFYHVNNTAFGLAANRAYLVLNGEENPVKGFAINFDTADGIGEVVNGTSVNGKWYNLAGQRVRRAERGLYIVNGKKVLVK